MIQRNLGRFKVNRQMLHTMSDEAAATIFAGMVVLNVRQLWESDQVEYLARHPTFAVVPEGNFIPEYEAVFFQGEATPTWLPWWARL